MFHSPAFNTSRVYMSILAVGGLACVTAVPIQMGLSICRQCDTQRTYAGTFVSCFSAIAFDWRYGEEFKRACA